MHTPTIFDQTDRTGPLVYYNNAGPDKNLSNLSNYFDNESDLGSDNYNNYESNYESDNEETPCASTSITKTPLVQPPNIEQNANASYSLRQKEFNNNFSSKNLLNEIRKIALSPPRDMSDILGSLEFRLPSNLFISFF